MNHKYLENYAIISEEWKKKFNWTDRERNKVLHRVKMERNMIQTIKRKKTNWICHILCINCLLKYVIEGTLEGKIEVKGRRGRRLRQLLDKLKITKSYCKLKVEAPDRTLWRTLEEVRTYRKRDIAVNESKAGERQRKNHEQGNEKNK
jgi:hypothetical protein